MNSTIHHGDCMEVMRDMPSNSIDAIVTDPPYGLGFMGKAWDALPPGEEWAAECLRVLKPGGHLLSFGGTRTWHRLAVAVEDAGFEIRDSIAWMYGSGFPKSLDVSKAIDKAGGDTFAFRRFARAYSDAVKESHLNHAAIDAHLGIKSSSCYWARDDYRGGMPPRHHWEKVRDLLGLSADLERIYDEAEREVIGERPQRANSATSGVPLNASKGSVELLTAPATAAAQEWQGWGTALKPAFEPVVVARKPLTGTVAQNVLQHGTGALNIDACRIDADGESYNAGPGGGGFTANSYESGLGRIAPSSGRWPANVALDEAMAEVLDEQSGNVKSRGRYLNPDQPMNVGARGATVDPAKFLGAKIPQRGNDYAGEQGGASRFFYVAKAPKRERPVVDGIAHPTVKPLSLMRWLVRLVTPEGGVVLDPFAGSGTTVEAAILEGFQVIGIEREAEYLPLIQARIERAA